MAYLVAMRGHFTADMSPPPPTATPTGRFLFIIIGPQTLRLRSYGVGNKLPPALVGKHGLACAPHDPCARPASVAAGVEA
jgi:hypothetical protein